MPDTPTASLERDYITRRASFETLTNKSISTETSLRNFIGTLKKRIENVAYLTSFSSRASELKNSIFQYLRDHDKLRRARGELGTYTAFYMNKSRWIEKYGSLDGWNEYMDGIDIISYEKLEEMDAGYWRFAMENLEALEKLWKDVRDADEARGGRT